MLGERAVIVTALPLPTGAEGIFTTDSAGRRNRLNRILIAGDGQATADVIALPDSKRAMATAMGARSKTYVVASPAIEGNLSILELTPLPLP